MAKNSKTKTEESAAVVERPAEPRSLKAIGNGIQTSRDYAKVMSALMADLIDGRMTPAQGNATCNAGGKLLRIVELQYKYGTQDSGGGRRTISLTLDDVEAPALKP